ncbi:MAG: FMN-binding protein [Clostridia bacterium]|nr:FMN-binding protein [Clostridia bacterium]
MKKYIKSVVALTAICAVVAILLAAANSITKPIIDKNEAAAANEALLVVMPNGGDFTTVDLSAYELPASVNEVYAASNGGHVMKLTVNGFNPGMVIMCGVGADGTVTGATCLSSGETLGHEKVYGDKTVGATVDTVDSIDTVAGATKTTAAYKSAVKDALNAAIILGGGSVELRTEAEILADNLAAALPAADGFTSVFMIDTIEGVDSVYSANNGTGYVVCVGDSFVATDANGKVISEGASTEEKAAATSAVATLLSWELTAIDLSTYADMPSAITAAYSTSSGNYVFDVKASGYGISGDKYTASGEYIYIKVSVTADGKIITCETVSQKESDGFGSACADASFYTQFNGKTAETYKDIDAIAGATITTNGYTTAISRVFEAVNILKGEA